MIDDEAGWLEVGRGRILAVRFVGTCFALVGGITALAAVYWIIDAFRVRKLVDPDSSGLGGTIGTVVLPVAIGVAGTWFFFGIGRGLRRGSPLARRVAVILLVPACVPPLMLLFHAIRAGVHAGAVFALVMLAPPAAGSVLLTAWKTDGLFRPKGAILIAESGPAPTPSGSAVGLLLKVVVLVFGLVATLLVLAMSRSPE